MNFFKVLLRPDREERENGPRALIARAANILQIGEFQLLQLAYRDWHGEDLSEHRLSGLFATYMLNGDVPPWARHFARRILEQEGRGDLNENDPNFHRFDHEYHGRRVNGGTEKFVMAVTVLAVVVGGGIWFADLSARESASQLPPFFTNEELRPGKSPNTWGRADHVPTGVGAGTDGKER